MSIDTLDTLEPLEDTEHVLAQTGPARSLAGAVVRPALLAGEEHEAPDPSIFRGTD